MVDTVNHFSDDHATDWAAALAYYTLFSVAPLLLIAIALAGLIFGAEAARGEIMTQIEGLIGSTGAKAVQTMLASASQQGTSIAAAIIGFAILIWGAAGIFTTLRDALNTMWGIVPPPTPGIWGIIKGYLVPFGMVMAIGFILVVSLVISAGLSALGKYLGNMLPVPPTVLHIINIIISLVVIAFVFALLFKYLPAVRIKWRDVWIGGVITSALFTIGKYLIGLYLGRASVSSTYGAAASFVVLLLWIDYSAQIFLLGAEFTQVYANRFGAGVRPVRGGKKVTQASPEEQPSGFKRPEEKVEESQTK